MPSSCRPGWREDRHHSPAGSNDNVTESNCNASRMHHPLYKEGQPFRPVAEPEPRG